MKKEETDTIAKLKKKILFYTILQVFMVFVLVLFGVFLFRITLL
jgi:flagellar basal body-associated protein FliL